MICIEHITSSHAEPKLRQPLYFSRYLLLHFRRNASRFREQRYCVSSPVCQTGVVHVLLQVKVTSVISILTCYVFRLNKTYLKMTPSFWLTVGLFLTEYSNHIKYPSATFSSFCRMGNPSIASRGPNASAEIQVNFSNTLENELTMWSNK